MEETNFVLLWKEHYEKIDRSLAINQRLLHETISQKAQHALQSLIRLKTRGIASLVIYLVLLGLALAYALRHYSTAANYFLVSLSVIFAINVRALYDYIKHLVWARQIDFDGPVTDIQSKLNALELSIFRHARIMVLQFPLWTTVYLSDAWFPQSVGWGYYVFQFLLTGGFTVLAIWLYRNQRIENAEKPWLRTLIAGSGGRAVRRAAAFYKDMQQFTHTGNGF